MKPELQNKQPSADVGMYHGTSAASITIGTSAPSEAINTSNSSAATSSELIHQSQYPRRKNIRAKFHDYSGGEYFVTICTEDKELYFGSIKDGKMYFSAIGRFAHEALELLHTHYSYVEVPLFVVMPNHVHAIICIRESADAPGSIPTVRTALGVVVGGYKQSVTRYARRINIDFDWQSRYHDHIIRDTADLNKIGEYIENNVARWDSDCFCT